jgi:hypothetical protein
VGKAPFSCSTQGYAPGLAHKQRLARRKRTSLLQQFVSYGRQKIYKIGPRSLVCSKKHLRPLEINEEFFLEKKLKKWFFLLISFYP